MFHIILLILKIIGIVILAVLGFVLLLILTVLLVPVRYHIVIEHGDTFYVKGRVSWLLHVIHAGISYIEDKLHICVRLFGIIVFDNMKPKKPKRQTRTHPKKASGKKKKGKDITKSQEGQRLKQRKKNGDKKEEPASVIESSRYILPEKEIASQEQIKKIKQSFFQRITARFCKIKDKLITGLRNWIKKIKGWFLTLRDLKGKWDLIFDFAMDEMNRQGFCVSYKSLKKLLKHILPGKLKSRVIFGTGDPCSTGQLLGLLGILYSFYGDKLQITPDFENSRLEGSHDLKGRIRLITLLIMAGRLILDRRFKQLRRNFISLKEAL